MSSIVAYLNTNEFLIATDTFVHEKGSKSLKGINFASKTYYVPQFKSCFAGQGIGLVLTQFFVFLQQHVIGKDLNAVIKQALKFRPEIEWDALPENLATIYLFGVNDVTNTLESYKLMISQSYENEINPMEQCLMYRPEISGFDDIIGSIINDCTMDEILVKLMIEQKKQDSAKPIKERWGIGGQVQVTTMIYNPESKELLSQIKMHNAFSDFEEGYLKMLDNAKSSKKRQK